MPQRSWILTVSAIALLGLVLMFPHSRRRGVSMAMGDMQQALERVNTWHLRGWKRVDGKKAPWEVWGSRNPFFYHERIGENETLDNGRERTIVVPPNYGMKGVVLIVPSRPDAQSNVGLAFLLGLNKQNAHAKGKLWDSDAETSTYAVDCDISFGGPTVKRADALFTFPNGSPLPLRYERLERLYRAIKDARGTIQLDNLPEEAKQTEWISAHVDAQYDVPLPAEALGITPRAIADFRTIHAVEDAAAGDVPQQNAVSRNGLTLHAADIMMDGHGNLLLRMEGYVGDINFAAQILPLSFITDTNIALAVNPLGGDVTPFSQRKFDCRDDRNRRYIQMGETGYFGNYGAIAWMALTPLEPLQPGEPLPRHITFPLRMSIETSNVVPEIGAAETSTLVQETMEVNVDLPGKIAKIDLKALSRKYGVYDGSRPIIPFAARAAMDRADKWRDIAMNAIMSMHPRRLVQMPGTNMRRVAIDPIDPEKQREAERLLQRAANCTAEAIKAVPSAGANLTGNLDTIRKLYAKEVQAK